MAFAPFIDDEHHFSADKYRACCKKRRVIVDPLFYFVAVPAIVLLGLSKGGFAGLGALSLPMMAMVISPVQAAAILLPILIIQDIVGVWAFRKNWDRTIIAVMLPGAVVGIALGAIFAAEVSVDAVLGALGTISIVFGAHRLWIERGGRIAMAANAPNWVGTLLGALSGFTSQIAHAGGPPFQMWIMPKRLDHLAVAGTTAVFFAAVNWIKVPAYFALGQFTNENLLTATALLPVATLSTLAGVRLVRRVSAERFYAVIYVLMILVGFKLLIDAIG